MGWVGSGSYSFFVGWVKIRLMRFFGANWRHFVTLPITSSKHCSRKSCSSGQDTPITVFKQHLANNLDHKFWSIAALHWIASFLDPRFKQLDNGPGNNFRGLG